MHFSILIVSILDGDFFLVRMMKQWNRFHRKVIDVTSLEIFKVRCDRALSNLAELKMFLFIAGELRLDEI